MFSFLKFLKRKKEETVVEKIEQLFNEEDESC